MSWRTLIGRGRGERHDRRRTERAQALAELQVRRSEVVAPFRDTVRLVDRRQTDARLRRASVPSCEPRVSGVVMTSSEPPARIRSSTSRRALPRTVPSRRTQGMFALEQLFVLIAQQRQQRRDQHHRFVGESSTGSGNRRICRIRSAGPPARLAPAVTCGDHLLLLRIQAVIPRRRAAWSTSCRGIRRLRAAAARARASPPSPATIPRPFRFRARGLPLARLFPSRSFRLTHRRCHGTISLSRASPGRLRRIPQPIPPGRGSCWKCLPARLVRSIRTDDMGKPELADILLPRIGSVDCPLAISLCG